MPGIVLASSDWHSGVIGIAASRVVEAYHKPAVLIAVGEDGVGRGSGRSVKGVDLYGALSECRDLFTDFGGHELAAGLSIKEENIQRFRERFGEVLTAAKIDYAPRIDIDCEVGLESVDEGLVEELGRLAPFGIGNPEPVFVAGPLSVASLRVLKEKHVRFTVSSGGRTLNAIWFNAGSGVGLGEVGVERGGRGVSVVFTPEFNVWNGRRELRLRVLDVDIPALPDAPEAAA